MKRLFRNPECILSLGGLIAGFIFAVITVLDWLKIDPQKSRDLLSGVTGASVAFVLAFLALLIRAKTAHKPTRVFISYKHEDADFAAKLASILEAANIEPVTGRHSALVG